MSRIDDLLSTHCPNGVKCKSVGSAFAVVATARGVPRTDYAKGSAIPVVDQGQSAIAGFTDDLSLAVPLGEYVVFGDHTRAVKWVDFQFAPGADGTKVLQARGDLLPKFGFYALDRLDIPSRGYNRHWTILRDLRIPVPPLEVQREIVRILDQFSQLEAELEARRAQYEHYAGLLLANKEQVPRVRFGELATIVRGASPRPIQKFITNDPGGVPWIKIGDVPARGKFITGTGQRVTPEGAAKSRRVRPGDFVLSNSMSFGRPYISKIDGYIHDGWLAVSGFEASFIPDYLYYLLRSSPMQEEFARRAGAGTVKNLNAEIVRSVEVPVPTKETQKRVVDLLDRFDALVNDLSVGLPAELAARRKQYEHYRDRLLTFTEAS